MMFEEPHTPCVLTCIVYYCKNAENARNVSWTFYQRLGDAWQLGWALGGGGADTGPASAQAIMQSALVINQINRGEIEFIIQDQPEGEIDFNLKWYQFA